MIGREEQLDPGDFNHTWAQWVPMSLPIKGAYDGYGPVVEKAKDEDWSTRKDIRVDSTSRVAQFQLETLQRVVNPWPEKEPDYPASKTYPNNLHSIMQACDRGFLKVELSVKYNAPAPTRSLRVSPFYIRESTYQLLTRKLEEGGVDYWRTRTEGKNPRYVRSIRNTIERSQRDFSHLRKLGEEELAAQLEMRNYLDCIPQELTSGLMEMMPDPFVLGYHHDFDVTEFKTLLEFEDEDWEELNYRLLELQVMFFTMHRLFMPFRPNMKRSQFSFYDSDLDGHRFLARHIDEEIVKMQKKFEEERED